MVEKIVSENEVSIIWVHRLLDIYRWYIT